MITIYFLQHAQVDNAAARERIEKEKAEQAMLWLSNEKLWFDGIACSSTLREKQTFISICNVLYTDALNEVCQGDCEGKPCTEILTPEKLDGRMMNFVKQTILDKYNEGTFLLVGYDLSFKCFLQGIMGVDPKMTREVGYGDVSLSRLRYEKERGWFVDYLNRDIISEILSRKEVCAYDNIAPLTDIEMVRRRPRVYISNNNGGKDREDGIYTFIDEVLWFAVRSLAKRIELTLDGENVTVRHYGTPTPFELLKESVTEIKCSCGAMQNWNPLHSHFCLTFINGLSSKFAISSTINGRCSEYKYRDGVEVSDKITDVTSAKNYTEISYLIDKNIIAEYSYNLEHIESVIKKFISLNPSVEVVFNGMPYRSEIRILDLLNNVLPSRQSYPPILIQSEKIQLAFTHTRSTHYDKEYNLFVNGYRVSDAELKDMFVETFPKVFNEIYNTDYTKDDIFLSLYSVVLIEIDNPAFSSSVIHRLGRQEISKAGFNTDFIEEVLRGGIRDHFAENPQTAELLLNRVKQHVEFKKAEKKLRKEMRLEEQKREELERSHGVVISGSTLYKGPNNHKAYTIPDYIDSIHDDAFENYGILEELTLPRVLFDIEDGAFPKDPKFKLKIHRGNQHLIWNLLVQFGAENIELID